MKKVLEADVCLAGRTFNISIVEYMIFADFDSQDKVDWFLENVQIAVSSLGDRPKTLQPYMKARECLWLRGDPSTFKWLEIPGLKFSGNKKISLRSADEICTFEIS